MLRQIRSGSSPGAHLRAEIEKLGVDQIKVADATGVSRQTINNIVNDRQTISRAMAAKLGRLTGHSSDYWLRSRFADAPSEQQPVAGEAFEHATHVERTHQRPAAVLANHEIIRAIEDGVIEVEPFAPTNITAAALDLTLDDFVTTADGEEIDISQDQSFALEGGQAVTANTCECIAFPLDHVGRIGSAAQLAKFGIIMAHGFQVEPGYKGHLQFTLFNAVHKPLVLRSGERVISLEIAPLNTIPALRDNATATPDTPRDRTRMRSSVPSSDNNRVVRDFLAGCVKISDLSAGPNKAIAAKIPDLEIDIVESTQELACASAVSTALDTFKIVRTTTTRTTLGEKYEEFFDRAAGELHLSSEQAMHAVASLGLRDKGPSVVALRGGVSTILQIPKGSAKLTLRTLARQLQEHPGDLGMLPYHDPM